MEVGACDTHLNSISQYNGEQGQQLTVRIGKDFWSSEDREIVP